MQIWWPATMSSTNKSRIFFNLPDYIEKLSCICLEFEPTAFTWVKSSSNYEYKYSSLCSLPYFIDMGQINPRHEYRLVKLIVSRQPCREGFGDERLDMKQQCALSPQKDNHTLNCMDRGRWVWLWAALIRLHCVQLWSSQHKKHVGLLEWVQRRAMEMFRGLEHLSHEHRLRALGFFSVKKRRLQGDIIKTFQYFKRAHKNSDFLSRQLVKGQEGIVLN